jgi:glucose-1-phosphate thymidylyltransferase
MNLIIPMAGRGSRLRPHTLTIPKPLVPLAGKPIVERLAESLTKGLGKAFDEIAFVIGDFGKEIEDQLCHIARKLGATPKIYKQDEPLGPAHAVYCASPSINQACIVAFADTLFYTDFKIDTDLEGLIWVKQVDNPSSFGVVVIDEKSQIQSFEEKPESFVSDLAIVGLYYFSDGLRFKNELNHLITNNIKYKGEFQLTSVLENLHENGWRFGAREVTEWLDCGNKSALVKANRRILEVEMHNSKEDYSNYSSSCIIEPCHIGENVRIKESIIGPYVSIGNNTTIEKSIIENSIIQNASKISYVNIKDSMIGNHTKYCGSSKVINIGDFSQLES